MKVIREMGKGVVCLLLAVAAGPVGAQTVEYIHTDALGTPVAVTNSAGVVVERSEYEPYGALLNRSITDGPGFTGHVQDAATGLTYMQQRYYDPMIGRFLSVDPVVPDSSNGAKFNRYVYARNNPYAFTDPDGRDDLRAVLQKVGGLVGNMVTGARDDVVAISNAVLNDQPLPIGATLRTASLPLAGELGAVGRGGRAVETAAVAGAAGNRIADSSLVVRGGSEAGANSAQGIAKGTGTHPAGVTGFSAESANGASLCQLCANVRHNQVGVTTAGEIRAAGGDVVSTSGVSPTHATVTGLAPGKAAEIMKVQPNPVPAADRNFK